MTLRGMIDQVLDDPDYSLVKALQTAQQNFVITDPTLPDNPIVFASQGFLELTGYTLDQVRPTWRRAEEELEWSKLCFLFLFHMLRTHACIHNLLVCFSCWVGCTRLWLFWCSSVLSSTQDVASLVFSRKTSSKSSSSQRCLRRHKEAIK